MIINSLLDFITIKQYFLVIDCVQSIYELASYIENKNEFNKTKEQTLHETLGPGCDNGATVTCFGEIQP